MGRIAVRQAGVGRRPRGLGQVLPTCASLDASQNIPQGILVAGGGLATLVGVIGAIFSDQYRKQFAIAAGAGIVSSFIGGLWAGSTFTFSPQCTGPGMPSLGAASVNPDQSTPAGQQPGLFGPSTPTPSVLQATAANPQVTDAQGNVWSQPTPPQPLTPAQQAQMNYAASLP